MKTFFTFLLMLSLSFVAFAQKKTFQVETGINYPIGLVKDGNKENHIGFYILFALFFSFFFLYSLPAL